MRLIDADKLIEKLRDFKEWENDDGRPIHTMSEIQRIDRCINFAQTEPIAFDVDKVLEQLEKDKFNHTHADRIRNMSDEELAEFLCKVKSDYQWMEHEFPSEEEHGEWKDWLQSEAE